MAFEDNQIRVVVESYRQGEKIPVTVGELGQALTVSNRILNRLSYPDQERFPQYDASRQEPAFVELEITEIRQGSVVLDALVQAANHPFVQNVAGSIVGAVIYEHGMPIIRSTSSSLRRLAHTASGKTLVISVRIGNAAFRIITEYRDGHSSQQVERIPPDDVQ